MAYSLSYSSPIVSEGSLVTITLSNTGLPDGTLVPFIISGTGISSYDFLNLYPIVFGASFWDHTDTPVGLFLGPFLMTTEGCSRF